MRALIIDKTAEPGTTSRALAVQGRTLEFYRQLGLADAVVARGRPALAINIWVSGRKVAHAGFADMGEGLSPYPCPLIFPQDEHERLLIDRLAALGVNVERRTELIKFERGAERVVARIKQPDGGIVAREVAYLAGCDGAHSLVREAAQIGFPGGKYEHLFYVADVQGSGATMDGELHVALDHSDFLAIFPLAGTGRARLVGTMVDQAPGDQGQLSWNDVGKRVLAWIDIAVERVNWFSTYRVHHRVADRFRDGRIFLLGDAAHIHSPVGGQGMNTGIGDAVNLAWKLAAALHGRADVALLDSYHTERIGFARRLVATTDQLFVGATSGGLIARIFRLRIVPILMPMLFAISAFRRQLYRTASQTRVHYRSSQFSAGRAGTILGGDRLPWVKLGRGDNFESLVSLDWQVHVYGEATAELRDLCAARRLPLQVFAWRASMRTAGIRRDALYLVRPDGYIGLADGAGGTAALESYLHERRILIR